MPTNVGQSLSHGLELNVQSGRFSFNSNLIRAYSSSASQFAYNNLNAPAVVAGQLFPVSYEPGLTAELSYQVTTANKRLRITPSVSYATEPFNGTTNPYIGNLGTNEGSDPDTLRSMPKTLINLHIERDITSRLSVILDIANLFNTTSPTEYQSNPYLIGPPGYKGGNPTYAACYGQILRGVGPCASGLPPGSTPYVLGNGIPTNDGANQTVPWVYGVGGYVPQSYPMGRTLQLRIRYRF